MDFLGRINQSLANAHLRFKQKKDVFSGPQQRLGVRKLQAYLEHPSAAAPGVKVEATGKTLYAKYVGNTKYASRSSSLALGGFRQYFSDTRHNEKTRLAADLIESAVWLQQFDDSNELRCAVQSLQRNRDFNDGKFYDTKHFRAPLAMVADAEDRVQGLFEEKIQKMKDTRAVLMGQSAAGLDAVPTHAGDLKLAKQLNAVWSRRGDGKVNASAAAVQKFLERASETSGVSTTALLEKLLLQRTVSRDLKPEVFDALVSQYQSLTLDRVR